MGWRRTLTHPGGHGHEPVSVPEAVTVDVRSWVDGHLQAGLPPRIRVPTARQRAAASLDAAPQPSTER
ncbi:MAG: hypothetical protein M3137_13355 [Actinomycetota bacterium]|nr:hypothetical protein [Actinomycetota bacterium]